MGNAMVGKSTLVSKIINDSKKIDEDYEPTVEDQYNKTDIINDEKYKMTITDTGDVLNIYLYILNG